MPVQSRPAWRTRSRCSGKSSPMRLNSPTYQGPQCGAQRGVEHITANRAHGRAPIRAHRVVDGKVTGYNQHPCARSSPVLRPASVQDNGARVTPGAWWRAIIEREYPKQPNWRGGRALMVKLLLVDGHNLLYRTFHATIDTPMTTSRGEPTNATYGFAATLLSILKSEAPTH